MTTIERCEVPPVALVRPKRFGDERGWFSESWREDWGLLEAGSFVQDNHAYSARRLVVRGLHFQTGPSVQAKLLRVVRGAVLDVAVDIRRGRPTYGRHVARELSAQNGDQLFVPHGFAHGYATLTDETDVLYKVDATYDPDREGALRWDDPALGIAWPTPGEDDGGDGGDGVQLSDKDRVAPLLHELESPFAYDEGAPYNCRCL